MAKLSSFASKIITFEFNFWLPRPPMETIGDYFMKRLLTGLSALVLLGGCASIGEVPPHAEGQSKRDAAINGVSTAASIAASGQQYNAEGLAIDAAGNVITNALPSASTVGVGSVGAAGADALNSATGTLTTVSPAAQIAAANLLPETSSTCTTIYQNYAAAKATLQLQAAAQGEEAKPGFSIGGLTKTALTTTSSVLGVAGVFAGGSTPTKLASASAGLSGASNLISIFSGKDDGSLHSPATIGEGVVDGPVNIKEIAVARAFALSCPLGPIING